MGAMVAYEVAKLMEEQGQIPVTLFAIAQMCPDESVPVWELDASDEDFLTSLIEMGGVSADIFDDKVVREMVLRVCRNDNEMEHRYMDFIRQPGLSTLSTPCV